MKTLKALLLFGSLLFCAACSKDDDAEPSSSNLDNVSLSLTSTNNQVISTPSAMASSDDLQAQMANAWVSSVNGITSYLSYLKAPANAKKSSTMIVATNGRVADAGDVVVYTWEDANKNTIGYQISESSDSYKFDLFQKLSGQTTWLKYFHAEEKKDRSSGSMVILDIFGVMGSDKTTKLADYSWTRSGDVLAFTMVSEMAGFTVKITINEKTKAGDVVYYIDGVKEYQMTWTSTGTGTWKLFDSDGNVDDSGSW